MSFAVRGYTSIADSQSTAPKGYNCNLLRPVHGMLRQAPRPAFHAHLHGDEHLRLRRNRPPIPKFDGLGTPHDGWAEQDEDMK
jgi:hypothetical protein